MTDRIDAITERVTLDLMDHLDDLDKHARGYIREYVETIVGPQTTRRPRSHLHPKLAELVRELALDAASMDRRTCGATSAPSNHRGDGQEPAARSPRRKAAA